MQKTAASIIAGATLAFSPLGSALAQTDDHWYTVTPYDFAEIQQIAPASPVAGGNDSNTSDDVLYVLESNEEETEEILEDEKGIVRPNGRPVGQRRARKTHVFVNPSTRLAAKVALSKSFSLEAFVTGGAGAFRDQTAAFGTRATNGSGGLLATADLGLANAVVAFEHRDAYADNFGSWKSTGDKIGSTVNKTLPFFIQNLTMTPQVLAARDMVNPARSSATTLEATAGLTYTLSPRLALAASAGYAAVFLYGLPGIRHDDGPKALIGANYKIGEQLMLSLGASTSRTVLYGLPRYRTDGSFSPSATARFTPMKYLTLSVSANYARLLSTVTGNSTFKYNINPAIAVTIPL